MRGNKMVQAATMVGPRGGHYRVSASGHKVSVRVRSYPAALIQHAQSGHGLVGEAHRKHFEELTQKVRSAHPAHLPGEHQRLAAFHDRKWAAAKAAKDMPRAGAHARLSLIHADLARK